MVVHVLVVHADEKADAAGTLISRRRRESKAALAVSLGACHFLHSLRQLQQDHIVPGGRSVDGLVDDRAGDFSGKGGQ